MRGCVNLLFDIFTKKLHEIERIWTKEEAHP